MKVFSVIVTYNGAKWINECIESLLVCDVNINIIVIDNGSTDSTLNILNKYSDEIKIFALGENLGFGRANNKGITIALRGNATHILLLNQDAYWYHSSFKSFVEVLDSTKESGILSPVHLAGNKKELDFGFYDYLSLNITPFLISSVLQRNRKKAYISEFVNAAAWLVKAEVFLEVGGFHPIFDHYGEDNEFINRIKSVGYKLIISPDHYIVHDRPQSRQNNKFFLSEKMILRTMLLNSIKNNFLDFKSNKRDFLKYAFKELVRGNLPVSKKILMARQVYIKKIHYLQSLDNPMQPAQEELNLNNK